MIQGTPSVAGSAAERTEGSVPPAARAADGKALGALTMRTMTRWMVMSGAAALLYEVVLQKLFSYLLGASLLSATITIASYMVGFSIGALALGRSAERRASLSSALRQYAGLEIGIGVIAFGGVVAYALASGGTPLAAYLPHDDVPRAFVAFLLILPLATLLGGTFPVITRAIFLTSQAAEEPGWSPTSLYAANLLGAVCGTLVGSYLIIPWLGLWGAAFVGLCLNVAVGVSALRSASAWQGHRASLASATEAGVRARGALNAQHLTLAFVSGLLLFAAEILWTHLLSAVVGSSVYAFATMLAAVLLGLYLAAHFESRAGEHKPGLSRVVLNAAVNLACSIPLFALAGFLFGIVGFIVGPSFFLRELTRFGVALLLIMPTTVALSRVFPRLLEEVAQSKQSQDVGTLTAANTIGCIAGLFVGRFLLVPIVGSSYSLRLLVVVLVALSAWLARGKVPSLAAVLRAESPRRKAVLVLALLCAVVPSWRPQWLLSSRNIYFSMGSRGDFHDVKFMEEDAESGFVTVHRSKKGVLELRTNGKFEGNDTKEMLAQLSFGYLPSFVVPRLGSAFLIGLGTGVTLKGLVDFPFEHIDIAERSRPMIDAARTYFGKVNGNAIEDPRVTLIHDDGRNALLGSQRKYDVVSIEITSIWFAGAADLYSRDFYRVAKQRMTPDGILQQWVQLHHMRREDMWIIIHTLRSEFKYVAMWYAGGQGQLVASDRPITVDYDRVASVLDTGKQDPEFKTHMLKMLGGMMMDERAVDAWMDDVTQKAMGLGPWLASSDLWPYLEYATPKGNVLDDAERLNLMWLRDNPVRAASRIKLRNTEKYEGDPRLAMVRAYFDRNCGEAGRLARELANGAAPEEPFASCQPWILVPAVSR